MKAGFWKTALVMAVAVVLATAAQAVCPPVAGLHVKAPFLLGVPVYRDGQLLAESVYRFKGQSAPAVILSEIDFEALDDRAVRKLFVGMTRARMKLVLVLSDRAAALLAERTPHGSA